LTICSTIIIYAKGQIRGSYLQPTGISMQSLYIRTHKIQTVGRYNIGWSGHYWDSVLGYKRNDLLANSVTGVREIGGIDGLRTNEREDQWIIVSDGEVY
jgi:hypothetical protein